jgi:hypothetical protein
VLAVVDDQQRGRRPELLGDHRSRRAPGLVTQPKSGQRGVVHEITLRGRAQPDQVDAQRELAFQEPRRLDGQPGLPDAARTGDRHQLVGPDQANHVKQFLLPADQAAPPRRQAPVAGSTVRAPSGPTGDPRRELVTPAQAELPKDRLEAAVHGALGDFQANPDLTVRQPLRHQQRHVPLRLRQTVEPPGGHAEPSSSPRRPVLRPDRRTPVAGRLRLVLCDIRRRELAGRRTGRVVSRLLSYAAALELA